jgi:hypothetical protein
MVKVLFPSIAQTNAAVKTTSMGTPTIQNNLLLIINTFLEVVNHALVVEQFLLLRVAFRAAFIRASEFDFRFMIVLYMSLQSLLIPIGLFLVDLIARGTKVPWGR